MAGSGPTTAWLTLAAATVATGGLWWLGTGLGPVAALTWLAPLPLFAVATRVPRLAAAGAAVVAWWAGGLNMWTYFVQDIENWSTRSGVVKVNCAISRLPTLAGEPGWRDFSGGFEIAPSVDQMERSFEEARAGRPATLPFSDGVIPTTLDPSLAPEGAHVVSLFTQWVPATWSEEPHREELEAYADRVVQAYEDVAPGFRESIVARQVLGPYDMETEWNLIGGNIFHGELSADQLFHMRPAPGYADYRTPIDGLYQCSSATHGGGGVSGIPAYNCVREIRRDRKRRKRRR